LCGSQSWLQAAFQAAPAGGNVLLRGKIAEAPCGAGWHPAARWQSGSSNYPPAETALETMLFT